MSWTVCLFWCICGFTLVLRVLVWLCLTDLFGLHLLSTLYWSLLVLLGLFWIYFVWLVTLLLVYVWLFYFDCFCFKCCLCFTCWFRFSLIAFLTTILFCLSSFSLVYLLTCCWCFVLVLAFAFVLFVDFGFTIVLRYVDFLWFDLLELLF